MAKCLSPSHNIRHCCFSPDGKFLAGVSGLTVYVWDITSSDPHLVNTFKHTWGFTSIIFSSSLTLLSAGGSIQFWDISASSTNPAATNSEPTPTSAPIRSVTIQANDGIVITFDEARVVRIWDISTGCCKESFHSPVTYISCMDVQLISGRFILVWYKSGKIHICDARKGEYLQVINVELKTPDSIPRISGDGSKVFWYTVDSIQAWSISTGKAIGEARLRQVDHGTLWLHPLCLNDSKIWVCFKDLSVQGWDFEISDSSPIPLSDMAPDRLHLHYLPGQSRIVDTVIGQEVFRLSGRYVRPSCIQWDGWYLATGYDSGEVLILDFIHMLPQ